MSEIIPGYDCVAEVRRIRRELSAEVTTWKALKARLDTAQERLILSMQQDRLARNKENGTDATT